MDSALRLPAELSQERALQIFRFSCSQHSQEMLCLSPALCCTVADSMQVLCTNYLSPSIPVLVVVSNNLPHRFVGIFLCAVLCFSVPVPLFLLMRTEIEKNSPPHHYPFTFTAVYLCLLYDIGHTLSCIIAIYEHVLISLLDIDKDCEFAVHVSPVMSVIKVSS